MSTAQFSLLHNDWVTPPTDDIEVSDRDVERKARKWRQMVERIIDLDQPHRVKGLLDRLDGYRECGLTHDGNYSPEHLVFRLLSRDGTLDKIKEAAGRLTSSDEQEVIADKYAKDGEPQQYSDGNWVPYKGPRGGQGWQSIHTGEIVYGPEPPSRKGAHDVIESVRAQAAAQRPPSGAAKPAMPAHSAQPAKGVTMPQEQPAAQTPPEQPTAQPTPPDVTQTPQVSDWAHAKLHEHAAEAEQIKHPRRPDWSMADRIKSAADAGETADQTISGIASSFNMKRSAVAPYVLGTRYANGIQHPSDQRSLDDYLKENQPKPDVSAVANEPQRAVSPEASAVAKEPQPDVAVAKPSAAGEKPQPAVAEQPKSSGEQQQPQQPKDAWQATSSVHDEALNLFRTGRDQDAFRVLQSEAEKQGISTDETRLVGSRLVSQVAREQFPQAENQPQPQGTPPKQKFTPNPEHLRTLESVPEGTQLFGYTKQNINDKAYWANNKEAIPSDDLLSKHQSPEHLAELSQLNKPYEQQKPPPPGPDTAQPGQSPKTSRTGAKQSRPFHATEMPHVSTAAAMFGIAPGDVANQDMLRNFLLRTARNIGFDPSQVKGDRTDQSVAASQYLYQHKAALDAVTQMAKAYGWRGGSGREVAAVARHAGQHLIKSAVEKGWTVAGNNEQQRMAGAIAYLKQWEAANPQQQQQGNDSVTNLLRLFAGPNNWSIGHIALAVIGFYLGYRMTRQMRRRSYW